MILTTWSVQLGRIGDEHLRVFDQAAFALGEEVLSFLEVRPRDGTLYTSALWQGKWEIEQVTRGGERVAVRYAPDALERGVFKGAPERRALAPLAYGMRARNSTDASRGVMRSFQAGGSAPITRIRWGSIATASPITTFVGWISISREAVRFACTTLRPKANAAVRLTQFFDPDTNTNTDWVPAR